MLRIWGRLYKSDGSYTWVQVSTDPTTGDNSAVYLTWLIQVLKLQRNESPFFANWGIPATTSVATQIFPNIYVSQTQRQFAPYFASLIIALVPGATPTYTINAVTTSGVSINLSVVAV